jgi:hypothetical protein
MDITSLIEIIIVIGLIYLFLKLIVSPIFKIILGIIIFLVLIYILQRFFNFDLGQILAPFGISLKPTKLGPNFNWLLVPLNHYIDQIQSFFSYIWGNFLKSTKQ